MSWMERTAVESKPRKWKYFWYVDNVNSYFLPNKVPAFDVMFGGQKIVPASHSSFDSPLYVAEKYYSDSIKGNS